METNSNGYVAIKYYQTVPHTITISGYQYAFVVQANICMAWIKPEDVDKVLSITRTCCGGHKNKSYLYANESDVRRWTNKGGR